MNPWSNPRLLRIRPLPTRRELVAAPDKNRRYDESTGQIYDETIMSAASTGDRYWHLRHSHRRKSECIELDISVPDAIGTSSLFETAVRCMVEHAQSLNNEVLEFLPCSLAKLLWQRIYDESRDSLAVWQAFSTTFATSLPIDTIVYRCQTLLEHTLPIPTLLTALDSPSFAFVTLLTIFAPSNHSRASLAKLHLLANLAALDLDGANIPTRSQRPGIDDALVRSWSRSAQELAAFTQLKVLILRRSEDLTPRSLTYLNAFPALAVFWVEQCDTAFNHSRKFRSQATDLGWTDNGGKPLWRMVIDSCPAHGLWDHPLRTIYEYATRMQAMRPVLNFRVGGRSHDDECGHGSFEPIVLQRIESAKVNESLAVRTEKREFLGIEATVEEGQRTKTRAVGRKKVKIRNSRIVDLGDLLNNLRGSI